MSEDNKGIDTSPWRKKKGTETTHMKMGALRPHHPTERGRDWGVGIKSRHVM